MRSTGFVRAFSRNTTRTGSTAPPRNRCRSDFIGWIGARARLAASALRTAMIMLDGVSKVYRTRNGRRTVLDNVTVVFEAGHNFGILGVNGAGKSTLIRLLAGSEEPDGGVIRRYARVSFPLGFGRKPAYPCP